MRIQLCSILFLLPLATMSCAVEEDSAGDLSCDEGTCDGLGDFDDVSISLGTDIYYACADSIFDVACENFFTHDQALVFPKFSWHTATAEVRRRDESESAVYIEAQDNRLLAPSERAVAISNVRTGINGFTSRGGLKLEFRVDGDREWISLLPSRSNTYWDNVEILPELGRAEGTRWYCEGNWCESREDSFSFESIQAGQVVEYRMTLIPIWDIGEFDTGRYSIRFDLQ